MDYYINLVYSLFMFITGLMFGSFFTLAIYRLPRHEDITHTRSYCPNCKHKLGFFDCFPILSYVSTIGRCRYCNKPISIRYPLIELASGFVFLLLYLFFGFTWQTFALIICYIYLFLVIGSDVMKEKMTDEEKLLVEKIKEEKKSKKKGAINVDIIVAIIAFVIFFTSTIFVFRNYTSTLTEYEIKSNALNLCLNKMNELKTKTIDELTTSSDNVQIDGISYDCNILISPYIKNGTEEVTNAKVIDVSVSYILNGKTSSIELKSLKVEEI